MSTGFGVLLGGMDMVLSPAAAWGNPSQDPPGYLGVNCELDRKSSWAEYLGLTGPAWSLLSFWGLDLSRTR